MSKRYKVNFEDEDQQVINTTILDVCDDCLNEIFKFLTINDLLCVRASNSRFKTPTERAFVWKQSDNPIDVSNHDTNLEHSLNILKQFGQFVSKLCVNYKMEGFDVLMKAIVEHCGHSVKELELHHEEEEWYLGLHRTSVRRIKRQLRHIGTKFPKLRTLAFKYDDSVDCPYADDIIQAIPNIRDFSASGVMFSHEDVCKFIALNGQLERLQLYVPNGVISQSFVNKIDELLPKLQALCINNVRIEDTLDDPDNPEKFKNLNELTFGRFSSSHSTDTLPALFCTNIHSLTLYCDGYFIPNFVEIISRFEKLTHFTVRLVSDLSVPSIAEFGMSIVSSKRIKELILANKHLVELSVIFHHAINDTYKHTCINDVIKDKLNGVQWKAFMCTFCEDNFTHIIFEI